MLRCVSAYYTVCRGNWYAGRYTQIEINADEHKRVYSSTHQIRLRKGKALQVRWDKRQVTLGKWEERLPGSSKGEWTHLLIHNLEVWLNRGHRQMDFYVTQVMSGYGVFNTYLFHMKLVESPKCTNNKL